VSPGRLIFPHTNSTPRRIPSPYYSLKPVELSSTEPPLDYSPTASRPPSLPYKSHRWITPRLPPFLASAHSIHNRIALPPSSVRHRFVSPSPGQTAPPTNAAVRFPSVPSFSRCFCGELPPFVATAHHAPTSAPPRLGRESTVDRPE
jgi:hypothetical protein